uniref:Fe2OG dioxygenase domain-containing protein n=1 Tax=Amphora coffeiformis TaxID=265554 RepID=A0A7S3LEQ0_9STRA
MNYQLYPWLKDLESPEAQTALDVARKTYLETGTVTLPRFVTADALQTMVQQARAAEDAAFTTDETHTAYLADPDYNRFDKRSVYNHSMRTQVASIAFDELPKDSPLASLYRDPILLQLASRIVTGHANSLHLSADPLGCCSINVFRPNYHHSFHFDESVFSTTLMLQEASDPSTGLFQCTPPLRPDKKDLALPDVAAAIQAYDQETPIPEPFAEGPSLATKEPPRLRTLDFQAGTLSFFSGSCSLHRVTRVKGTQSRLVAVLTYGTQPGFCNSAAVQKLFWGRSVQPNCETTKLFGME